MASVFRAIFGYLFLVLMVRAVGRHPGKQMAPFDYVLIFFIGGLTLTGNGHERSPLLFGTFIASRFAKP